MLIQLTFVCVKIDHQTCIKCKKKGGTEFLRKVEKNERGERKSVTLICRCKADNPCDLNIEISLASYKLYEDLVKSIKENIDKSDYH